MVEAQPISSPMVTNYKLSKSGADIFFYPTLYQSVVGALLYTTIIGPEISFTINKVCQFISNPLDTHWVAVKRILRYLKGSISHGLHLKPTISGRPLSIRALCYVDWVFDVDDHRSTSQVAIYLGPNLVSWWSIKQVVTRSSTGAEYRSLTQATHKTL